MGKRSEHVSKEGHTEGVQVHRQMVVSVTGTRELKPVSCARADLSTQSVVQDVGQLEPVYFVWECKMLCAVWKVQQFLKLNVCFP